MIRALPYVAAVAFVLSAMWWAYGQGISKCQADHNEERLEILERQKELDNERIKIAKERADTARQVQESINADPIVVHRCLGPSRGVQLNAPGVGR